MVKRRVRAKDRASAMRKARREYPSLVVTDVNWLQDSPKRKGKKLYEVVAHKRKK